MKIGILLHIFADTTAHQMFSGFKSDVNNVKLIKVINNHTGMDETSKYRGNIVKSLEKLKSYFVGIHPVGHMMIAHIPDYTHLTFTMEYTDAKGRIDQYVCNNTDKFIDRSKQILNYLLSCRELDMISDSGWNSCSAKLQDCFLTDISKYSDTKEMVRILIPKWSSTGERYYYSSEEIKKGFVLQSIVFENTEDDISAALEEVPEELRPLSSTHASDDFFYSTYVPKRY